MRGSNSTRETQRSPKRRFSLDANCQHFQGFESPQATAGAVTRKLQLGGLFGYPADSFSEVQVGFANGVNDRLQDVLILLISSRRVAAKAPRSSVGCRSCKECNSSDGDM